MPTYQYECLDCKKEFEQFQKMSDKPLDTCILCGRQGKVKRLIGTGAGVIFKGSGFYETDYKRKSTGNTEVKKTEESSSKTEKTKTEKADAKKTKE